MSDNDRMTAEIIRLVNMVVRLNDQMVRQEQMIQKLTDQLRKYQKYGNVYVDDHEVVNHESH